MFSRVSPWLLLASTLAACAPMYESSTVVRLRSPEAAALSTQWGTPREVLPAHGGPAEGVVAQGSFPTNPGSRSGYCQRADQPDIPCAVKPGAA